MRFKKKIRISGRLSVKGFTVPRDGDFDVAPIVK